MGRETAERGSLRAGGSWGEVQTPADVETMRRRLRGPGSGTKWIAVLFLYLARWRSTQL